MIEKWRLSVSVLKQIGLAGGLLCVFLAFSSCSSRQDAGTSSGASHDATPTVDAVKVIARKLETTVRLPGELQAYEVVSVFPKTAGFVDSIPVDRGSRLKKGDLIARLVAPEVTSQRVEAESKVQNAEAQRLEAVARLAAGEGTYRRLKGAAATPGVISGNELEIAEKTVEADRARIKALHDSENAARAALKSLEEIEGYLQVRAPFDGVVTERNVHPGALVGPQGGAGVTVPIVRVETVARLRLVVAVPESVAATIPEGTKVNFAVPAFPGEVFQGTVARIAHSLDVRTRTMPVELDVINSALKLAPGMFPEVIWPVQRKEPTLFVPPSAVVRTTERVFVVRIRDGKIEWVNVKTGLSANNLVEVFGDLKPNDLVALRATDELRPDSPVNPRVTSGTSF